MTFKFFGSTTLIDGVAKLRTLGQEVDLDDQFAREIAKNGGVSILPAEAFDQAGITADELTKYPKPADLPGAPREFQDKVEMLHMLQAEWLANPSQQQLPL
jgi:hypothetical protein